MSKAMLVCAKCGFMAFVNGRAELDSAGWLIEEVADGALKACCPACRADGACKDMEKTRARSAGKSN
jgi:hypothetical protein